MALKRGSIVLVPFLFTDLSNYKIRPSLILNPIDKEDFLIFFISSNITEKINPTDFKITKDMEIFKETGLKYDSLVKCNKMTTIAKKIIFGELGELPMDIMKTEINERLKIALSIT